MVQLEDLLGQDDQVNLPGSTTEHPNWRRKLPLSLEDAARHPRLQQLIAIVASRRASGGARER
jgi:4-alpha-glucanotransferase